MAEAKGPKGAWKPESNAELPKPKLRGATTSRIPSADEMKEWEAKAGLDHEDPTSTKQTSETFTVPGVSSSVAGEFRGVEDPTSLNPNRAEGAPTSAWEAAVPGNKNPGDFARKQRPHKPQSFGPAYAKHMAGENASPQELDKHVADWKNMSEQQQYDWQQGEGKEALKKFKADYTQSDNAKAVAAHELRDKVRTAAFPTPEARTAFEEKGELKRDAIVNDVPNPKDPVQRAAVGEPSTLPESDWRRTFHAHLTSNPKVGIGLGADPSHFERLESHINDLDSRKPHGSMPVLDLKGNPVKTTSIKIAPNNLQSAFFGDHYRLGGDSQGKNVLVLQKNQFHPVDNKLQEARESLAKAAKAHTLGYKELALNHFRRAVDLTGDVADIQHRDDKARGANNGEAPVADWDKGDKILSDYRKSIGA